MSRPVSRFKLRHAAAGVAGSFFNRNNDYLGNWAIGQLYADAAPASKSVRLDLLTGDVDPRADGTLAIARAYADFLRRALEKHGLLPSDLLEASITIRFDTPHARERLPLELGEPYIGVVHLGAGPGRQCKVMHTGFCVRYQPNLFSVSTRGQQHPA